MLIHTNYTTLTWKGSTLISILHPFSAFPPNELAQRLKIKQERSCWNSYPSFRLVTSCYLTVKWLDIFILGITYAVLPQFISETHIQVILMLGSTRCTKRQPLGVQRGCFLFVLNELVQPSFYVSLGFRGVAKSRTRLS